MSVSRVLILPPTTVDGRNPAPVDMVNIPLFTGFYTSQVVVWHFFHQQYQHVSTIDVNHHGLQFPKNQLGNRGRHILTALAKRKCLGRQPGIQEVLVKSCEL